MPRIFDNINERLLSALQATLATSCRADFCVGYFNLRGWRQIDQFIDAYSGGDGNCCRLLVGMQQPPEAELRAALRVSGSEEGMDNATALRLKKRMAEEFRNQMVIGAPTNEDEAGLRRLAAQLRAGKVKVKLYLRNGLHAKLYLVHNPSSYAAPIVGFVGSSNLTMAGISSQGELNVDVVESDAALKLSRWFDDRWNDHWCLDITNELAQIIEEGWPREQPIPPYHIFLKMAYHLSQEARTGLAEFRIPGDLEEELFDFQKAAVKIAAHHLNKRGGVLLGDVVGLGKTLMATAVARIFDQDRDFDTLILCPKNLVPMWEEYRDRYRLHGRVLSTSMVQQRLPEMRPYRLVALDESHNLRNREGRRYKAIQDYIRRCNSKVILLSATPYNKSYLDLGGQLRLFLDETQELSVRPQRLLREMGEAQFVAQFQCGVRTLAAFEKSEFPEDWRELMRLYMVRRTRSFIQETYAKRDDAGRTYLPLRDGSRSYFPVRRPRTARFAIDEFGGRDQYARLYAEDVVDTINRLLLPRYGLGNYVTQRPSPPPDAAERAVLDNLSRAGKRLMGFSRTNLFKRLESSGAAFLQSVERHILRNYVFLHALEHDDLKVPIGTQDVGLLDATANDEDELELENMVPNGTGYADPNLLASMEEEGEDLSPLDVPRLPTASGLRTHLLTEREFERRAAQVYHIYETVGQRRFKWLRKSLFTKQLKDALRADSRALLAVLQRCGAWQPDDDAKLTELVRLLTVEHPHEKVLIFSQFADTVDYLAAQLPARGVDAVAPATGDSPNPTALAWRFSPVSNGKREQVAPEDELRVLVATDVLSEGQNLQDAAIVVNYDLPWAIIRLIQRVGRVDRIGQRAEEIDCYSFLPADGVERLIRLRGKLLDRLRENAEVVGGDEAFFEGDGEQAAQAVRDLYNERAGILDGDADGEVDLASYAYQIWHNAITADPGLQRAIEALPSVVYSAKSTEAVEGFANPPAGVLAYVRTAQENDALVWLNAQGEPVSTSQMTVLDAARCLPGTPAQERTENHHALVRQAVELVAREEQQAGGSLGRPGSARYRAYQRLTRLRNDLAGTLFESPELDRALDDLYRHPLRPAAADTINRQLRTGVSDEELAELVTGLRNEGRLSIIEESDQSQEPQVICSLGLV